MRAAELVPRGRLDFEFEGDPKLLEVHVFECTRLHADASEPHETEEMRPAWDAADALPYDQMWVDDRLWLPTVLAGGSVADYFVFRGHDVIVSRRPLTPAELASGARAARFPPT